MLMMLQQIVGTLTDNGMRTTRASYLLLLALLKANSVWNKIGVAQRPPQQLKPFAFIIALAQLLEQRVGREQTVKTMRTVIYNLKTV